MVVRNQLQPAPGDAAAAAEAKGVRGKHTPGGTGGKAHG